MNELYSFLVLLVWFMSTYFVVLMLLVVFDQRKNLYNFGPVGALLPCVSVVLPAYNEEDGVIGALTSLLAMDYPRNNFEVIVVNDGSKDGTSGLVNKFISEHKDFDIKFIDRRENRGKASSLNEGISAASGELVACMDGDSIVSPDILSKTVGYFADSKVGSVSVRVNVRNPRNLLEKVVDVEYSVGLSTSLKFLSLIDSMHVTPGPFSIYRKSALVEIGLFDEKNITEDLEIAFRLQRRGYKLLFCISTSVYTTVPSDLKSLYKQRRRWYSGSLLTLWQHKDMFFSRGTSMFRTFLLFNYALIFFGLSLFLYSIYLYAKTAMKTLGYMALINFDVSRFPLNLSFDPLSVDIFTTLAAAMILLTIILVFATSRILKKNMRENFSGFLGYLFFFVFYQIFWLNSLYSVFRGREIKWR
jgi:cellulose synthase/poly-beta-1,6-N-acetylglucosamine synthase-like glycosyltransferase